MEDPAPIEKATQKGVMFHSLQETEKDQLEKEAKEKQKTVKSEMKSSNVDAKHLQEFTVVVNGFSTEVKQGDLEQIKKLRSEEHTSELQSRGHLVCRLLL